MPPYDAVIFDLDGTLIDTERLIIDAAVTTLAGFGLRVERSFLTTLVGVDEVVAFDMLQDHVGRDVDLSSYDKAWSAAVRQAYARGIPLMTGVAEFLDHLSTRGLPRAVATNSHTANARRKLGEAGIAHHFDPGHVVGFDLVPAPKPAPDVFVDAARRLGVDPRRCLAFEDSDTGVTAALAAGMTVVQVPDMRPAGTRDAHHLAETLLDGARAAGIL
jgi:HAD superfamily hydrolase (TIGR01509 family)